MSGKRCAFGSWMPEHMRTLGKATMFSEMSISGVRCFAFCPWMSAGIWVDPLKRDFETRKQHI